MSQTLLLDSIDETAQFAPTTAIGAAVECSSLTKEFGDGDSKIRALAASISAPFGQ